MPVTVFKDMKVTHRGSFLPRYNVAEIRSPLNIFQKAKKNGEATLDAVAAAAQAAAGGADEAAEEAVTGCGRLQRARSRLYRNEILQVNMRLKALAEVYTVHSFAPFWNRIPKNEENQGGGGERTWSVL